MAWLKEFAKAELAKTAGAMETDRASLALKAGNMASWAWDIRSGLVTGDELVATFFNLSSPEPPWDVADIFAAIHEDDIGYVQPSVERSLHQDEDYVTEFRVKKEDGSDCWLGARGRVISRDENGKPLSMLGLNWDITTAKEQERRLTVLAAEMDHRVKNAFAVMRSLINLAGRTGGDSEHMIATLEAQCMAMAEAHASSAKLSRARADGSAARDADLGSLLRKALSPWTLGEGKDRGTVFIDAVPDVTLPEHELSAMAMIVYELTTNATKYGALGIPGGHLDVILRRDENERVILEWKETVPPRRLDAEVLARLNATDGGFGATLLRQCARTLRASMARELTPAGLQLVLIFPVEEED